MSLTRQLREELAHAPLGDAAARLAEAAAVVRFAGTLVLRGGGGGLAVEVRTPHAAVARRLRGVLVDVVGVRPGLSQVHGGDLAGRTTYLVQVAPAALARMGVLGDDGRPREGLGSVDGSARRATVAGALMGAGSLSGAGQPVHLEVAAPGERTAADLARLVGARASGNRVVLKSGDAVVDLLAEVGATQTALAFDQGRQRRDLRRQVNRSVNADRANLRRATAAAAAQIDVIEEAVARLGWDGLPDDLREVALVRVANPEASLAELGQLLDPPVGKATVHRRLRRLEELAAG